MDDRENRIRNRAYAIWQSEGGQKGRHVDHWRQAETELDATDLPFSNDLAEPEALDIKPEDAFLEPKMQDIPPARTGQSERSENSVTSGLKSNPIHHEGKLPVDPLTK